MKSNLTDLIHSGTLLDDFIHNNNLTINNYHSYESGDGSAREETGVVKNAGTDEAYVAQSGFYKYIDVDGAPVEVHYTADENGFVPFGTSILESISAAAKAAGKA